MTSYGSLSFTYNARGDLETQTSNGQTTTFKYDAFGNLRRLDLPGGTVVEYVIDGQNRRVGRKVNGALERGWLYRDQLQPVAELTAAGAVRQQFVRAEGEHSPDVVLENGVTYRVVKDQVGTVVAVVNASTGAVVLTRDSRAFGEVVSTTGAMDLRFGFAGGLVEAATGAVRFGARDYLPRVGRWASKDPAEFDQEDGPNLYSYAANEPMNRKDTAGLESEPCSRPKYARPKPTYCSCSHDDNKTSHGQSCQDLRQNGTCSPPYEGKGSDRSSCISDARANAGVCAGCFKHCQDWK